LNIRAFALFTVFNRTQLAVISFKVFSRAVKNELLF